MTSADKDRFLRKVKQGEGCWLFTASLNRLGYGQFGISGKVHKAHRVAWRIFQGEIPAGMSVLHKCDVRNCVNPDHLFLGTQLDNMRDCKAKGRLVLPAPRHGEQNHMSKLTQEQVTEMREHKKKTGHGCKLIAKTYGVSAMTVYRAVTGQSWGAK